MTSQFAGLRPPTAPPELKARVLERCAGIAAGGDLNVLDRLWESQAARLAWLASVALLIAVLAARNPTGGTAPALPAEPGPAALLAELELSTVGFLGGGGNRHGKSAATREHYLAVWE